MIVNLTVVISDVLEVKMCSIGFKLGIAKMLTHITSVTCSDTITSQWHENMAYLIIYLDDPLWLRRPSDRNKTYIQVNIYTCAVVHTYVYTY